MASKQHDDVGPDVSTNDSDSSGSDSELEPSEDLQGPGFDLTAYVEEVVLRRRHFLSDLSELESRIRIGMLAVFSIVASILASRMPVGEFRHVLSAVVVACCTWQSVASVRTLHSAHGAQGKSSVSFFRFVKQNSTLLLVMVSGCVSTILCAVDSVRHAHAPAGREVVLFTSTGMLYFVLASCNLLTLRWGRARAEGMEDRIADQLDAEVRKPDEVGDEMAWGLRHIERKTYYLSQVVLSMTLLLLILVPKLVRALYFFELGVYILTYGMTSINFAVWCIEDLLTKADDDDVNESEIIRMTLLLVPGIFAIVIGSAVMQFQESLSEGWLRGTVLLATLCLTDVSSVLARTRMQANEQLAMPLPTKRTQTAAKRRHSRRVSDSAVHAQLAVAVASSRRIDEEKVLPDAGICLTCSPKSSK